jgi:hypothetical protein
VSFFPLPIILQFFFEDVADLIYECYDVIFWVLEIFFCQCCMKHIHDISVRFFIKIGWLHRTSLK